jgi:hypothetical protein
MPYICIIQFDSFIHKGDIMKAIRFFLVLLLIILAQFCFAQKKISTSKKIPKITVTFSGGLGYVIGSANGNANEFSTSYDPLKGGSYRTNNLGMQQGYGLLATGKSALGRKKKLRITGTLGYNLFYNTEDGGRNRTKWNIFNLGTGVEYCFEPKNKNRLFIGGGLDYNLMLGAWQSDITYPDNHESNIYTRFRPASRIGMNISAGMEFRLNRKTDLVVAIRGVWVNAFPKRNYYSNEVYETYINDSKSHNGIEFSNTKEIIYIQIVTGITLPVSYR